MRHRVPADKKSLRAGIYTSRSGSLPLGWLRVSVRIHAHHYNDLYLILSSVSNSLRVSQELIVLGALFFPSFSAHRS